MIVAESKNERNRRAQERWETLLVIMTLISFNTPVSSQYHKVPSYFVVISQSQYRQEGSPTLVMV